MLPSLPGVLLPGNHNQEVTENQTLLSAGDDDGADFKINLIEVFFTNIFNFKVPSLYAKLS